MRFLDFLCEGPYDIYVFSAGEKEYVEEIVDALFMMLPKKPIKVFTRNDCEIDPNTGETTKRLHSPKDGRHLDLKTSVMIDDRSDVVSKNREASFIMVPRYRGLDGDHMDSTLDKIMRILEEMSKGGVARQTYNLTGRVY